MKHYTIKDLKRDFPTDEACLAYIFKKKYPNVTGYYPIKGRKCYSHKTTRHQIHPLAGTVFEKSSTPLTLWFHALFLFASSKNGVSAKELERQLGVTYKTAWRIAFQIRELMKQDVDMLQGVVEVDETYIGGKRKGKQFSGGKGKTPVLGMVERDGRVKALKVPNRETHILLNAIYKNVEQGSHIISDHLGVYRKTPRLGYQHSSVNHWKKEYVRGLIHTNTIEGFWSQLKRSIDGTFHAVSPKHLQRYVDEFAFRYSLRDSGLPMFSWLVSRI